MDLFTTYFFREIFMELYAIFVINMFSKGQENNVEKLVRNG